MSNVECRCVGVDFYFGVFPPNREVDFYFGFLPAKSRSRFLLRIYSRQIEESISIKNYCVSWTILRTIERKSVRTIWNTLMDRSTKWMFVMELVIIVLVVIAIPSFWRPNGCFIWIGSNVRSLSSNKEFMLWCFKHESIVGCRVRAGQLAWSSKQYSPLYIIYPGTMNLSNLHSFWICKSSNTFRTSHGLWKPNGIVCNTDEIVG